MKSTPTTSKPTAAEVMAQDTTVMLRGNLHAALTLLNDAARRAADHRPDAVDAINGAGAAIVNAIRRLNTEPAAAPASAAS